ncbi:hypothetical protein AB1Y20_015164 [Prymnesium parvum]|uniref:Uncharacterized protein n=1 Tax=Prymnesium parvum TaxID=97485 RepID=A0AB34JZL2_PRYPA
MSEEQWPDFPCEDPTATELDDWLRVWDASLRGLDVEAILRGVCGGGAGHHQATATQRGRQACASGRGESSRFVRRWRAPPTSTGWSR